MRSEEKCSVEVIDSDTGELVRISWPSSVEASEFVAFFQEQLKKKFAILGGGVEGVDLVLLGTSTRMELSLGNCQSITTPLVMVPCLGNHEEPHSHPLLRPVRQGDICRVEVTQQSLGLSIHAMKGVDKPDKGDIVRVVGFKNTADGAIGFAQATGLIEIGDVFLSINGKSLLGFDYDDVVNALIETPRPFELTLHRPRPRESLYVVMFEEPQLEVSVSNEHVSGSAVVSNLMNKQNGTYGPGSGGIAERKGVRMGDTVYAVNGVIVDKNYDAAISQLKRCNRPLVCVFYRQPMEEAIITPSISPTVDKIRHSGPPMQALPSPAHSTTSSNGSCGSSFSCSSMYRPGGAWSSSGFQATTSLPPTPSMIGSFPRSTRSNSSGTNTSGGHGGLRESLSASSVSSFTSSFGYGTGDLPTEMLLQQCEVIFEEGKINQDEVNVLKNMVLQNNRYISQALRAQNTNAVVAILRSPSMTLWDSQLRIDKGERILLAGPVTEKKLKRCHMVFTSHGRLLLFSMKHSRSSTGSSEIVADISCRQMLSVSSRSKFDELIINTPSKEYIFVDKFLRPRIWLYCILPFTITQGYLKVLSGTSAGSVNNVSLPTKGKHFFLLEKNMLSVYKKDIHAHTTPRSNTLGSHFRSSRRSRTSSVHDNQDLNLTSAELIITSTKEYTFEILWRTSINNKAQITRLSLVASSLKEFKRWILSLRMIIPLSSPV